MTIQQLEYIVAIDNNGSFSKAAEICFVTQPTLSMQVQKLEEELGVTIFDRSKKPVMATLIGKKIIKQARVSIKSIEKINELVKEEQNSLQGELRVGILPTVAPYLLPLFISDFLKKYPHVNMVIEEFVTEEIVEKLKHDLLDAGIVATPLDDSAIEEEVLFYENFFAYVSPTSPLAEMDVISIKEIDLSEMLLLNSGHCFRNQVIKICSKNKKIRNSRNLKFESGSIESLKQIVESGYGYTLVPELSVLKLSSSKKTYLREIHPTMVREISLIRHRDVLKKNLLNALKKEILQNIPSHFKDKHRRKIIPWK